MSDCLWNVKEAAAATDGTPFGDWECTGISIDSRHVAKGDLFIALVGPSFDGHHFVQAALKAGASAAIVSHIPDDCRKDDNLLLVKDTTKALEDLGYAARRRTHARVIGVTGSVGKTGVKEALYDVLSQQGKTHATVGNLNNHFGLPLTLARMPKNCDYAVLELGMNHSGELIALSKMAAPHVAIITTIASAHLENFPTVEAIADAKCEIFSGLCENGTAILNADNAFFDRMKQSALDQGVKNIVSFGHAADADFKVLSFEAAPCGGSDVHGAIMGETIDFTISHPGTHWVTNSLAVLAGVKGLGANVKTAARDLTALKQLKGRGAIHSIDIHGGSITVIDESYNANEASMRAALSVLSNRTGRKIAVIGDMLELGPDEASIHAGLSDAVDQIDLVFTCGRLMRKLHDALPHNKRGAHASDSENLAPLVVQAVRPGDVISIKSSRGTRTDLILSALLEIQSKGNEK
jgi:UDP-N-acetylmuramoyl-tripeptide--D-alanyl-D-alanine ligase